VGKITDRIEEIKQHHQAKKLRKEAVKEYANDPDVEFHYVAPEAYDAPHGVNTPEEMTHSADPVAD
jgi:hypothetical protein